MNQLKNKIILFFPFFLSSFILLSIIREWSIHNYDGVYLCITSLILILLFCWVFKKIPFSISNTIQITIFSFIFCSSILGEVYHFYTKYPVWDILLHTASGFLCAGLGFSLFHLLNHSSLKFSLSKISILLFSVCFSMTTSVLWEFFEYGQDKISFSDAQKDKLVIEISSVYLDEAKNSKPVIIKDIAKTILYDKNDKILKIIPGGYLDIGINDTMKDLFANFIGSLFSATLGYFYLKNRNKNHFFSKFVIRKS